jgi:uncharacterized protein (UPF0276 family)
MRRTINEIMQSGLQLGIGAGWRPELALAIERYPHLGFVEVIAEDLDAGAPLPAPIRNLRERGVTVIPPRRDPRTRRGGAAGAAVLEQLARLAARTGAPFVSEHIAWVRAGGVESGHLLPLPRTREALDVLVENVQIARRALPVPLALENIAALFEWPEAEMDEADFLTEALIRTDCLLLLDISNLYANARNHGFDALDLLDRIPLERPGLCPHRRRHRARRPVSRHPPASGRPGGARASRRVMRPDGAAGHPAGARRRLSPRGGDGVRTGRPGKRAGARGAPP